jgi:hypothetical protein
VLLQDADDLLLAEPTLAHAVLLGASRPRGRSLSVNQISGHLMPKKAGVCEQVDGNHS